VRERALDAMDALGPEEAQGLDAGHQDDVADYLLGQSDPGEATATRAFLEGSPGGRAWARVVATELQPLSPAGLPEIPEGRQEAPAVSRAAAAPAAPVDTDADADDGEADRDDHEADLDSEGPDDRAGARSAGGPRSSKLGGVILLLGIAALLALVLVVALGKDDDKKEARRPSSTPSASTSTPASQPKVEQQINLKPTTEGSKALGVANVVSQSGRRAIALIGQDIKPAGRRYAVWLINDKTTRFLGFAPPVKADGRLQGLAGTPENLRDFTEIIVTREQVDQPKQPGTVVLRGPLRKE